MFSLFFWPSMNYWCPALTARRCFGIPECFILQWEVKVIVC